MISNAYAKKIIISATNLRKKAGFFLRLVFSRAILVRNNVYLWFYAIKTSHKLCTPSGRRFLELFFLLKDFLTKKLESDKEYADLIASQLLNVLQNCDVITYEEPGTAEAYALLHFLDRYHRFQLTFEELNASNLMPIRPRRIDILDVGTGPGPSMFAVSDFYTDIKNQHPSISITKNKGYAFSIDYVERSQQFRNWLHSFTEHANTYRLSERPWKVPFHHGTFQDFQGVEFNQQIIGSYGRRNRTKKFRYDLIIFSNFLTTKEQVKGFSAELIDCIRFLRNNGILVVVGAKSTSSKYKSVYDEISKIILTENFNNWKFIASCEKVELNKPEMGYSYIDCYGKILKDLYRSIYKKLQSNNNDSIHPQIAKMLEESIQPQYSRPISWEVHVFRKKAKLRNRNLYIPISSL